MCVCVAARFFFFKFSCFRLTVIEHFVTLNYTINNNNNAIDPVEKCRENEERKSQ